MASLRILKSAAAVLALLFRFATAQFPRSSQNYIEEMLAQDSALNDLLLETQPDLNYYFRPQSAILSNDNYRFDYPIVTQYRINMIIDPCRNLAPNCCMNVYGVNEYPSILRNNFETERQVIFPVIGKEEEVAINYNLIYEDAVAVPSLNSRFADDHSEFDTDCKSLGKPYEYCQAKNWAYARSKYRPACLDYNQTLNADNTCIHCTDPDCLVNTTSNFCVQVGYTSTTFIPQCGPGAAGHCGTFLEIHSNNPYYPIETVISSVQLTTRNVSGYYTTTIPLTWMSESNKILCAYTESFIRKGSLVYILPSAPVCCCPTPYKPQTRIGSWQCPVGPNGQGAFATIPLNLAETLLMDSLNMAYPYCPNDVTSRDDTVKCSVADPLTGRNYLTECDDVRLKNTTSIGNFRYGSSSLAGYSYDGLCTDWYPNLKGCAITLNRGLCQGTDLKYTFGGMTGIVTEVDNTKAIPTVRVSFNGGRTDYNFLKSDVKLELYKSMYEIWWVVKTPVENVVMKRKGFNITSPTCTLDSTLQQYFPYTILQTDKNGVLKTKADGVTHIPLDSGTVLTPNHA